MSNSDQSSKVCRLYIPIGFVFLSLCLLAAYVIQIILISKYTCSDSIVIFALVYGGIGGLAVLVSAVSYAINRCSRIETPHPDATDAEHDCVFCKEIWRVIAIVGFIGMTIMTIIGIIIVSTTDTGPNYADCDRTLYLYTMWNIIGHSILILITFVVGLILYCFPACYARYIIGPHLGSHITAV
jgi:hypothetical protein